ncbi:MAG: hypothetical protein IEMM0002_1429 [bacterium]|nr:MAG: hypothetical protein IEMM0002_1429 [bacterium]
MLSLSEAGLNIIGKLLKLRKSGKVKKRFKRVFLLLIAFSAILIYPDVARGLGLGDIKVKSSFNKKFVAVIPIHMQEDEGSPLVIIGEDADYQLMELARPEFIDTIRLTIKPDPARTGEKLIEVTSTEPIHKPSFNLIIRASAGGGTILENYFLAVDFRKSLTLELPKSEEMKEEIVGTAKAKPVSPTIEKTLPIPIPPVPAVALKKNLPAPPVQAVKKVVTPSPEPMVPTVKKVEVLSVPIPKPKPVVVPAEVIQAIQNPAEPEPPVAAAKEVVIEIKKEPPVVVVKEVETVKKPEYVQKPLKTSPGRKTIIPAVKKVIQPAADVELVTHGNEFVKLDPDKSRNKRIVIKGDSMYGIARKLGVSKNNRPMAVVAIYLENESAFIEGNINRLKSGVRLTYNKVNELAGTITSFDARAFIERQFVQWKKSRKRAPIRIGNPVIRRVSSQDVLLFLGTWKRHWTENDIESMKSDYANNFRDRFGRNKTAFLKWKKRFNEKHPGINLLFENIDVARMGPTISVQFKQLFRSDNYSSTGIKRLELKPGANGLTIINETFFRQTLSIDKHPWVVHLASYRGKATTVMNIQRLQAGGFQVFEASAFHPDGNKWYRLMAGRLTSARQARRLAMELKKAGEPYAVVLELPFALEVTGQSGYDESRELVEKFLKDGFSPYLVETSQTGEEARRMVYMGAFTNKREAGFALEKLREKGIEAEVAAP